MLSREQKKLEAVTLHLSEMVPCVPREAFYQLIVAFGSSSTRERWHAQDELIDMMEQMS